MRLGQAYRRYSMGFAGRWMGVALLALSLGGSVSGLPDRSAVRDGVWLWSADRARMELAEAGALYVFQGQVYRRGAEPAYRFEGVRPDPARWPGRPVILVYRFDVLTDPAPLLHLIQAQRQDWNGAGRPRVVGVQIDFDSPTRRLDEYATWLAGLRTVLPADLGLSITGLGDWLVAADPAALARLAAPTDFIAFMMYHGTSPLPDPARYVAGLRRAGVAFKLGLLPQQMDDPLFRAARRVAAYRGDLVFLLPRPRA